MEKEEIVKLFNNFTAEYDFKENEQVWKNQSEEFRQFWREKIMNNNYPELSEEDMDHVIRFFCSRARGAGEFKRSGGKAAALANIYQGLWYKAFRSLKKKKDIREKLNQIFTIEDENQRIILVDELEKMNQENRNGLTGKEAIILNAFLFTYNPDKYLPMLSTVHRLALIDFFNLGNPKQYKTYGEQVIKTHNDIVLGFKEKYEIVATPIELDSFIYGCLLKNYDWFERRSYWKEEINKV